MNSTEDQGKGSVIQLEEAGSAKMLSSTELDEEKEIHEAKVSCMLWFALVCFGLLYRAPVHVTLSRDVSH